MNSVVTLQSNWEKKVAEKLDEKNIPWIRPEPIEWVDVKNKSRLYFPDFYLPSTDIYLDPKNVIVMARDEEKIKMVTKKINLVVGELAVILNHIDNM